MARPEKPIVERTQALTDLALHLRKLRADSGGVKYQTMSKRVGYAVPTLAAAASGARCPTWAVTWAYVRACEMSGEHEDDHKLDRGEWYRRWQSANEAELDTRGRSVQVSIEPIEATGRADYCCGFTCSDSGDVAAGPTEDRIVYYLVRILSPRELSVMLGIMKGQASKQIALRNGVSIKTVEAATTRIYRKLGASSRADAVRLCMEYFIDTAPSSRCAATSLPCSLRW